MDFYDCFKHTTLIRRRKREVFVLSPKALDFPTWDCSHALACLLFEEGKIDELARAIKRFLMRGELTTDQQFPQGSNDALKQLSRVRQEYPSLGISVRQSPILWMRFGFMLQRSGVPLSDRFVRIYALWRQQHSKDLGGTMVHWRIRDPLEGGLEEAMECPLDYFMHAPSLGVDIGSQIDISLCDDYEAKATRSKKESTSDHVGRHARLVIEECIIDAAVRNRITGLTTERDGGRYICHLTRAQLVKVLRSRYPAAKQFGISTIIRTVGDFVACSRPRGN